MGDESKDYFDDLPYHYSKLDNENIMDLQVAQSLNRARITNLLSQMEDIRLEIQERVSHGECLSILVSMKIKDSGIDK